MIERKTFRNKPVLMITDEKKPHIRVAFGIMKARMILDNLDAIHSFWSDNQPAVEPNVPVESEVIEKIK